MTVIVIRCDRCGRRCRNPAAFVTDEWNATLRQGVVVGYLCPDCQTPEDGSAPSAFSASALVGVSSSLIFAGIRREGTRHRA
jgi:hypothetical protein